MLPQALHALGCTLRDYKQDPDIKAGVRVAMETFAASCEGGGGAASSSAGPKAEKVRKMVAASGGKVGPREPRGPLFRYKKPFNATSSKATSSKATSSTPKSSTPKSHKAKKAKTEEAETEKAKTEEAKTETWDLCSTDFSNSSDEDSRSRDPPAVSKPPALNTDVGVAPVIMLEAGPAAAAAVGLVDSQVT
jgi:hypothetical protein